MKNTIQRTKSGSDELVVYFGDESLYDGNCLRLGEIILSAVRMYRIICTRCGFSEQWADTGDMPIILKSKKIHK